MARRANIFSPHTWTNKVGHTCKRAWSSRRQILPSQSKHKNVFNTLKIPNIEPLSITKRDIHAGGADIISPSHMMGIDHLRNPRYNKGLAFTLEERQAFGIHGLLPPRLKTQEEQLELCKISLSRYKNPLNKYIYLTELADRNEKLFYRLLSENVKELMPIIYTPTVGLACQKFGLIYRRPRGLFITIHDRGHCFDILKNWPVPDVRAIVVTDGERILGLGDLGACGMGIPVGKLSLYTALAGVKPRLCLPVTLDVGTNNQTLLDDPLYIGLRQKRVQGKEYNELVDEFMEAVVRRYGQTTLIQFEDFGNQNAFHFLDRYRDDYCTFNDDIQGTASVALAGVMTSARITEKKITDHKFLFLGAGEAGIGIADLCVKAMVFEGMAQQEARDKIWMVDIDGLLAKGRPEGGLEGHKAYYAKDHAPVKALAAVVKEIKPSIMIGASTAAGAFTPEILKDMSTFNERPIIFALSNPTEKTECTAEQAYVNTGGSVIFASGSPFAPVTYNGKVYHPGQGNNAYIFPGVALGIILSGIYHVSEDLFVLAAKTIAENVSQEQIELGSLYPPLSAIKDCSKQIALKICQYAYNEGSASVYPEPQDMIAFVESQLYNYNYEESLPNQWTWPHPASRSDKNKFYRNRCNGEETK